MTDIQTKFKQFCLNNGISDSMIEDEFGQNNSSINELMERVEPIHYMHQAFVWSTTYPHVDSQEIPSCNDRYDYWNTVNKAWQEIIRASRPLSERFAEAMYKEMYPFLNSDDLEFLDTFSTMEKVHYLQIKETHG